VPGADTTVKADDISAIVALTGRIGVMWSDQQTSVMRFALHDDSAGDSTGWTVETPVTGPRSADDHINLKALIEDDSGQIYAAFKTSRGDVSTDAPTDPSIRVWHRSATGVWTGATAATVADKLTRAQLALDTTNRKVYVVMSDEGGGSVYYKTAPLGENQAFTPSSGKGNVMLTWGGALINNVTLAKAPITSASGLVVLASDDTNTRRYYHAEMSLAGGTPPPGDEVAPAVSSTFPVAGATGVAVSGNVSATFSEALDPTTVTASTVSLRLAGGSAVPAAVTYDTATRTAVLNPTADLTASAKYTATVTTGVKDVAGNPLAAASTWSFTTAAADGGTPQTVSVVASADSYVAAGSPGSNFGTAAMLRVDASPVEMSYLKFDLSAYAGRTLTSATLQVGVSDSGSGGKQSVRLVADDSWTETGVTYSNRPAVGTVVGTVGAPSVNTSYKVPLTASSVQGELGQALSLGMDTTSSDGLHLNSRETAVKPTLVLTFAP
jgi:hypothetical protein